VASRAKAQIPLNVKACHQYEKMMALLSTENEDENKAMD